MGEFTTWMTDLHDDIKYKMLRDIVIPGTHNSGSFHPAFTIAVRNQDRTIKEQLEDGIRYLDLEVTIAKDLNELAPSDLPTDYPKIPSNYSIPDGYSKDEFYLCHATVSHPDLKLGDYLDDIVDFAQANPKEIIIVDFHNITCGINTQELVNFKAIKIDMPSADQTRLINLAKQKFGQRLIINSGQALSDLINVGQNILLDPRLEKVHHKSNLMDTHADKLERIKEYGTKLKNLKNSTLNNLVLVEIITWTINVFDAANQNNEEAKALIPGWHKQYGNAVNIVTTDFYNWANGTKDSTFVRSLINLNKPMPPPPPRKWQEPVLHVMMR